jgi:A/G-specific adenine glycosylase
MCKSRMLGNILDRPVRSKRTKTRDRFFHYFVYQWENKIILRKRTSKDVWQHLFEFPLIETNSVEFPEEASQSKHSSLVHKHVLSHQKIHAVFHHFDEAPTQPNEEWLIVQTETLGEYPVPRLIENYLSKLRS